MSFPRLDAHLHLQDGRLRPHLDDIVQELRRQEISRWVVAGTSEADWPEVARLADAYPEVMPCYGLHPWFISQRTNQWEEKLAECLSRPNAAAVGEIGLDKWIRDHRIEEQEDVFRRQLRLAARSGLPTVIHCLKAWGRLLDVMRAEPLPEAGFLLHSFAGPTEMVDDFVALGGYFSFSGHFLHERKAAVLETFRQIPIDRILVETDAPDMRLPEALERYSLLTDAGEPLNHPANLPAIYEGLATALGIPVDTLADRVAANFGRLFRFAGPPSRH